MNKEHLERYTDYLLRTFGKTTATGLSALVDGQVSHDPVTRFLSGEADTSKELGQEVKSTVRKVECEDAVLIFNDTMQEKPYTDENEVMGWHYDHSKGRAVQGFNLLHCLYHVDAISIPVAFELVRTPAEYCDLKTRKRKRASLVTKHELMRSMIDVGVQNKLKFRFIMCDIWLSSKETMGHINVTHQKDFMCALKANRVVALCEEDYQNGRFISIEERHWQAESMGTAWLKGVPFPVLIVSQVFPSKDGRTGMLCLACSETTVTRVLILTTYPKRWSVEVFPKSLKQNASLGKAPVRRVTTQNNHVFAALYAFFTLECLKIKHHLNHFAVRAQLYLKATRIAFDELHALKAA